MFYKIVILSVFCPTSSNSDSVNHHVHSLIVYKMPQYSCSNGLRMLFSNIKINSAFHIHQFETGQQHTPSLCRLPSKCPPLEGDSKKRLCLVTHSLISLEIPPFQKVVLVLQLSRGSDSLPVLIPDRPERLMMLLPLELLQWASDLWKMFRRSRLVLGSPQKTRAASTACRGLVTACNQRKTQHLYIALQERKRGPCATSKNSKKRPMGHI